MVIPRQADRPLQVFRRIRLFLQTVAAILLYRAKGLLLEIDGHHAYERSAVVFSRRT